MIASGSLSDVRVIDLTQMLAGPICTQILADHGATVIKVESLQGDDIRRAGPFKPEDELHAFGGYFASVNRNKKSLSIDLKTEAGREILRRLISTSDVVIENFRAGVMERLGFSYESLRAENPALVYGAIRGFGDPRSGESPYASWPAYDVIAQAMGGVISITGPQGGPPYKVGPGVGDIVPALMMGIGLLSALHHARATGQGQFVDVAMTDSILALCERIVYQHSFTGQAPGPEGNRHPLLCPYGLFPVADGWVAIGCPTDAFWKILARAIGRPDMADNEAYASNAARLEHADTIIGAIEAFTKSRTKAEMAEILGGAIPFGPIFTASDIAEDRHFQIRNMIVELDHPGCMEPVRFAGIPIKMSLTPGSIRNRAPLLGEHTNETLAGLGYNQDAIQQLIREKVVAERLP